MLIWECTHNENHERELSEQLANCLAKKYEFEWRIWSQTLGKDDIPYLSGLRDAGVEDAQTLIDLIKKHGDIRIFHED